MNARTRAILEPLKPAASLLLLLTAGATAAAAVHYVDLNSPSPTAPFTDWSTAATNQGGPGIVEGLNLLKGSDTPTEDQKAFLKAQVLFWLIGATDGHAKNFSIFLGRGGRFRLSPVYDVLTAQPSFDTRQIERKQMKLAMFVGESRHYRLDEIRGRHFIQTTERAGLPKTLASEVLAEVAEAAGGAIKAVERQLPRGFPRYIHTSVKAGLTARLKAI